MHIAETNSSRAPKYLTEFIQESVKNIPLKKWQTQQKLVKLMGVSKTTVHHWIVASTIHVHCNPLKPILTEQNKWPGLKWTEFMWMRSGSFSAGRRTGISFSQRRKNLKHCIKHKSHIVRVMFLCAVVRPHYNPCSKTW